MLDVQGQISIDDALLECERERMLAETAGGPPELVRLVEMERLGDSDGFAWSVLEMLDRVVGWSVPVTTPFAGQLDGEGTRGVVILATHRDIPGLELRVPGRTVAECVPRLLTETDRYMPMLAAAARRRADRRQGGSAASLAPGEGDRRGDAGGVAEARAW